MKKNARLLPILGLFFLMGCSFPPPVPRPLPANPDYGSPPPENYQQIIKSELTTSFVSNIIFGSRNGDYEFRTPVKGHTDQSHMLGTNQTFGWVVCGTLYRKERFAGYGTYDGPIPFYVLFRNGKIAERLIGQTTYDHTVPHSLNDDVKKVCSRTDK